MSIYYSKMQLLYSKIKIDIFIIAILKRLKFEYTISCKLKNIQFSNKIEIKCEYLVGIFIWLLIEEKNSYIIGEQNLEQTGQSKVWGSFLGPKYVCASKRSDLTLPSISNWKINHWIKYIYSYYYTNITKE